MESASFEQENIELLAAYLRAGELPCEEHKLGFELEHIIVHDEDNSAVSYSEPGGVKDTLRSLASCYDSESNVVADDNTGLIGLARSEDDGHVLHNVPARAVLTLEPGAQLELSTGPFADVSEIEDSYKRFHSELSPVLKAKEQHISDFGYQPYSKVREIPLIPKARYKYMDLWFENTGSCGICMMRGSASTQVSIDFENEDDGLFKLRLATALGPLFALISDNTPIFEGALDTSRMVRTRIWNDVDPLRCNTIPGLFDAGFTFKNYARYVMETPLILAAKGGKDEYVGNTTASEIYKDALLETPDIQHILSMFFFDIRLKNYIEIRVADSLPLPYALAYAALIKGVFYDKENLGSLAPIVNDLLAQVDGLACISQIKADLIAHGYEANLYGKSAHELIMDLFQMAEDVLDSKEAKYLEPLRELARRKLTLADLAKQQLAVEV